MENKEIIFHRKLRTRILNSTYISDWIVLGIAFGILFITLFYRNNLLIFFGLGLSISIVIQTTFRLLYLSPFWRRELNKLYYKK